MVDSDHLQQALDQVREMRRCVLQRQRFLGYSAGGRLAGGALVLAGAAAMTLLPVRTDGPRLAVWIGVALAAAAINYGLCLRWYQTLPAADRCRDRLAPLLESLPPLALGLAVTAGLAARGEFDALYGLWMGLYGLVNFYTWPHLPLAIRKLGLFYLAAGMLFLLTPEVQFARPWPAVLVFLAGELAGGLIIRHHTPGRAWLTPAAAPSGRNEP